MESFARVAWQPSAAAMYSPDHKDIKSSLQNLPAKIPV
jgi:hypothetical protein